MKPFVSLLLFALLCGSLLAQPQSAARIDVNPLLAPFYHGVASGDPLGDRVILWTRVTPDSTVTGPIAVDWTIALDTNLTQVINSGTFTTDASRDYTVKVDADGLDADTYYYYGFSALGSNSIIGRTKTAPDGPKDTLRFAFVSCSNFQNGYFHAYEEIAKRNDVDAVLHLGDYIYEYGINGFGFFDSIRAHEPTTEIISIADYRMRHSQHKLDPDLRYAHQQYPWMVVWDDHETANNSWKDGADNHDPNTEGTWADRKAAGIQAYYEWMPLRQPDPNNGQRIYRNANYGDLAEIMLMDTRLEGREEQGVNENDPNRTILGQDQYDWLTNSLSTTTSQWKILAQQVVMTPLLAFGTPINNDQWDGYSPERTKLYDHILDDSVENVVVLTGDIHTSWANDLPYDINTYDANTGDGSVGVEFVVTSVTSTSGNLPIGGGLIQTLNPNVKFVDLEKRGFAILDLNENRAQADWFFLSDIQQPTYTSTYATSWCVNAGERFLKGSTNASTPSSIVNQPQAPLAPEDPSTGIDEDEVAVVMLGSYPNPFQERFFVEFYAKKATPATLQLSDLSGRILYEKELGIMQAGLHLYPIEVQNLAKGNYFTILRTEDKVYSKTVVKVE